MALFFDSMRPEYFPAVAELAKKTNPSAPAMDLKDLVEDNQIDSLESQIHSVCGFSDGELVCYIIAHKQRQGLRIDILDLNCPNPRYLKRLLLRFFNSTSITYFIADMRRDSYRLLMSQIKKHSPTIFIEDQHKINGSFEDGEPAYHTEFTIDIAEYCLDWKSRFQSRMDNSSLWIDDNMSILTEAIEIFLEDAIRQGVDLYSEKNKRFVINCVEEKLLGYYRMFEEKIPAICYHKLFIHGSATVEKALESVKPYGYTFYEYLPIKQTLTVERDTEVYNTKYRTLSGYRWLKRKQQRFIKNGKGKYYLGYLDRYGVERFLPNVPYLSGRQYLYHLNKASLRRKLQAAVNFDVDRDNPEYFDEGSSLNSLIDRTYQLLPSHDAETVLCNIVERWKESSKNYFHDWMLVAESLLSAKELLTAGAVKTCLSLSFNQALKIRKELDALADGLLCDSWARKQFNLKEVRKKLSSLIRRKEDYSGYSSELLGALNSKFMKRLKIPNSEHEKLHEFISRTRKYNASITLRSLYKNFGRKCLSGFINGTYPCIFQPRDFQPPYQLLGKFIRKHLKGNSARAKRVYHDLQEADLLPLVLNGDFNTQQYRQAVHILRHHNVALDRDVENLDDFIIRLEQKGSPEFLVAGDATVCCMSYGNEKAKVYAKEKGFGILNVYYRGRVIANSVIWVNEPYDCLVLDNIEVHPNYTKFNSQLRQCFETAVTAILREYNLDFAVQGSIYNDLALYSTKDKVIDFKELKPVAVQTQDFYSDAEAARVIKSMVPEEEISKRGCHLRRQTDLDNTDIWNLYY